MTQKVGNIQKSENLKAPRTSRAQAALICGGDAASVGHTGQRELVSREWLQETTERRRVKSLGARFV